MPGMFTHVTTFAQVLVLVLDTQVLVLGEKSLLTSLPINYDNYYLIDFPAVCSTYTVIV